MTNIVRVPFYGDDIEALHDGRDVWVSLKRMCENVELDEEPQRKKLRNKQWAVTSMMEAKSGKKRQGNLLDISRLLPSGYKP